MRTPLTLITIPILSATLLAGCASSGSASTASSNTTRSTTATASKSNTTPSDTSLSIREVFGDPAKPTTNLPARPEGWAHGPTSTSTVINPSSSSQTPSDSRSGTPATNRRVDLIGLYGEAISDSDDYDRSRPGRANISQVSFAVEGACFDPALNHKGTHIAFASTMHRDASDIYIKSINGTTVTQITSDPSDDVMPAFHPDGRRIAFASNRSGTWDIYITSIEGGAPVQVTNDPDAQIHPSFSPDGRMLAYCKYSSQSGRWEIWAVDLENPGVRTFLEYGMFPQWSPDIASSKLLFQRPRQRGSRLHGIWTIDYRNGEAINPTEIVSAANAAVINPSWSPDGRRIVFVSVLDPDGATDGRPDQSDVWMINVDGSNRIKLTDNQFANFQPVWASDGRVYFVSNRSGIDNIWAISTERAISMPRGREMAGADVDQDR